MPEHKSVVIFTRKSSMPRDEVQMQFVWSKATAIGQADIDGVTLAIRDFFAEGVPTGGTIVATWLSDVLSRVTGAHRIETFDITGHLSGSPAGPPIDVSAFTIPNAFAGTNLPNEVSVALSFHADLTGISEFVLGQRPRARRRGRIFVGPLMSQAIIEQATTLEPKVDAQLSDTLAQAAERFRTDLIALGLQWVVWSRIDAAVRPVIAGWIDNAFDTQRRRGEDPSARQLWGPLV